MLGEMPAGLDPARAEPVAFATPSPEEFLSVCAQTAEGSGALVVVDGAAGTGKSALLAGFAGAAGSDFVVVEARASELETDNAFGVVRRLFGRPLETPTRVTRHSHFAFL